jgi:hypothetical protein
LLLLLRPLLLARCFDHKYFDDAKTLSHKDKSSSKVVEELIESDESTIVGELFLRESRVVQLFSEWCTMVTGRNADLFSKKT